MGFMTLLAIFFALMNYFGSHATAALHLMVLPLVDSSWAKRSAGTREAIFFFELKEWDARERRSDDALDNSMEREREREEIDGREIRETG